MREFVLVRGPVVRIEGGENFTPGVLHLDGGHYCYTCEDEDRFLENGVTEKVYGRTAIPRGRYRLTITWSERFKRFLPLVNDVPDFTGVRFHGGNRAEHSHGCVLGGQIPTADGVASCAPVVDGLCALLRDADALDEPVWLEVK